MGKHTPPMNDQQLEHYLKFHLDNELQWLLRAATEWHVQKEIHLRLDGYQVQIYAMDSCFLHARTLFEFFTKKTTDNYYGCDAFGITPLASWLYADDWTGPLHAYIMHAQDRSKPRQLLSYDRSSKKDLNEMPVDFARELVHLWEEFATSLGQNSPPALRRLQQVAEDILADAILNTERVVVGEMVRQYNVKPIAW